jgi:type VI secretion system secreted protein VgrG
LRQAIWPVPPRPNIGGVLTGTVIGPAGQEIHLDKFGRVQVRFPWDRDNPSASCWVRVAQSWAGHGWGACFWPRVGHEVVVAFENGDPDRPIVVGSVYNSDNMPPFPLPENRFIAGWKSLTEGGDPSKNFHQILMSDEKGGEVVHIHAEKTLLANQESRQVTMRPNLDMSFQG